MGVPAAEISYDALLGPALLLFGADAETQLAVAIDVAEAGGRLAVSVPFDGADASLDRQVARGGVIIDARRGGGATLDRLLGRVDVAGMPAVVLAGLDTIDAVMARVSAAEIDILVEPSRGEIRAAIAGLVAAPGLVLRETGESNRHRLTHLREEVSRIARTLASLSDGLVVAERAEENGAVSPPAPPLSQPSDGAMVRSILRLRRLRDQHFEPALFADPAWDILLDLSAAQIERRPVAVSSLCIAAAVPPTTGLRWITMMTEQGILVRRPDPEDGRRVFIGLSDGAIGAMGGYIASARRVMATLG